LVIIGLFCHENNISTHLVRTDISLDYLLIIDLATQQQAGQQSPSPEKHGRSNNMQEDSKFKSGTGASSREQVHVRVCQYFLTGEQCTSIYPCAAVWRPHATQGKLGGRYLRAVSRLPSTTHAMRGAATCQAYTPTCDV
jgi:hypothetical protein